MSKFEDKYCNQDLCFGIDQSLTSSAWCVVAEDGKLLDYGLVRINPKSDPKNKKRDVSVLHEALESLVTPKEWDNLDKQWQQFYLAKASANMIVGNYSYLCNLNGFLDGNNLIHVCIEALAFSSSGDATRGLAGLQFLIIDEFKRDVADWGNPNREAAAIDLAPPTTIKKFATGNGRSDKEELFEALPDDVKRHFAEIPKTKGRYDLTDAYWIGMYGHKKRKERNAP